MKKILVSLALILLATSCRFSAPASYIELPILFSDHMVLQRDANIKVWGKATPHAAVAVSFKNQHAEIIAGEDSTWQITLAPEPAGGPYEFIVSGEDSITFKDVLVGEVWLASGQSNMEWPLRSTNDAEAAIAAANDTQMRLFTVRKSFAGVPQADIPSEGWSLAYPETAAGFSAVAYYFGNTLRDSLDVPVGLIHSSWGGTPAEAWTSATSLVAHPDYTVRVEAMRDAPPDLGVMSSTEQWLQALNDNDRGFEAGEPVWAANTLDDGAWETMSLPQRWEDAGLPGFDGIVWFRRTVSIPAAWAGKDLTVELAMIDDIDETWVNGVRVGSTDQYNTPRKYSVPASAYAAGDNVISVRVIDTGGGGGIWGEAQQMRIAPADGAASPIALAGPWKYRPAYDPDTVQLPARPGGQQHQPTVLYNAMIHPLVPYSIRGAIWYQGESNASRAHQYRTLFPMMIEDWRARWGRPLDFHFVQLANFMEEQSNPAEEETWPELREAQSMALSLPQTGMAVTIDIGEADDIHPRNKKDVGFRLALSALGITYERPVVPAGPLYRAFEIEEDEIRIRFENAAEGLKTRDNGPVKGFAIAGKDRVFYWGNAVIEGSEIVVSSPQVDAPVAVRYGWANNPTANLYNTEGLPASPFRTDDWPGITEGAS